MFTWNILLTSFLVPQAFPLLTAALFGLAADPHLGAHVFDPANGGAILWQGAHAHHRGDHVHAAEDGTESGDGQAHDPQVTACAGEWIASVSGV